MRLAALCDDRLRLRGSGEVEIGGLALDSRAVRAGDLFAAIPGTRTYGRRFLADALAAGAVAVLGDARAVAATDLPALVAADATALYARNILSFLNLLLHPASGEIRADEIPDGGIPRE